MSISASKLVPTIGLETHVQLNTNTKIWCGCAVRSDAPPNTLVCPVCLGYPGSLPVLNREAVRKTVMTGLLLGCEIAQVSKHDRKSYFYPDMPKNYQITQYDQPLCLGGGIEIEVNGVKRFIRINRIHLEEDVGKSTHLRGASGIDYNRAGTPLMEIVTEPDLHNEDEAFAYLTALKRILQYGGVSDCNLEEGNIRCDINVSVAEAGADVLGVKAEIKNMNTFRGVHRALAYEVRRQIKAVGAGERLVQETRRWDDEQGVTRSMRTKEDAHDYRYFPDPDLARIRLTEAEIEGWRAELPELPAKRQARFVEEYGLSDYDAGVLVADKGIADYFEAAAGKNPKAAANWVMTEVMRVLSESDLEIGDFPVPTAGLSALIALVDKGTLNSTKAKEVFAVMLKEGGDPAKIVEARGMAQVSDTGAIEGFVNEVIDENGKVVDDYRSGKESALQFLMGQVMKKSRGKANPPMVLDLLKQKLAKP
ncbi:MAG: Asp-tRNA(Asn)/Glu-tRNA(Gln) amidotransferase subunit GatB [Verrucomicrobia bacterium]|nr:Asp-tRNA(Asn)/Glu-tRNA(Gln) amidotransferase subunit GatB [Verrucomicrobiota bacterium]MCH8526325.1 Asp-tRNA(Asn)/Glu-tRNA(Gln) amidotransferase subunit GatB [Kiritimatiellia bacterium]